MYRAGDIITGDVTDDRHFGRFIDIGDEEHAVAVITMLDDEPTKPRTWPDIGKTVEGVFLGYAGPGHQPRISLRQSDIRCARSQQWAGILLGVSDAARPCTFCGAEDAHSREHAVP